MGRLAARSVERTAVVADTGVDERNLSVRQEKLKNTRADPDFSCGREALDLIFGTYLVFSFGSEKAPEAPEVLSLERVLSILSWIVFAGLLLGRWRYGWRGPRAVRLTLIAMSLLLLSYFGSRAVLEILGRI